MLNPGMQETDKRALLSVWWNFPKPHSQEVFVATTICICIDSLSWSEASAGCVLMPLIEKKAMSHVNTHVPKPLCSSRPTQTRWGWLEYGREATNSHPLHCRPHPEDAQDPRLWPDAFMVIKVCIWGSAKHRLEPQWHYLRSQAKLFPILRGLLFACLFVRWNPGPQEYQASALPLSYIPDSDDVSYFNRSYNGVS